MNQNPGDDERSEGNAGTDAPLHEALDDLENMLGPHGVTAPGSKGTPPGIAPRAGTEPGSASGIAASPERAPGMPLAPAGAAETGDWDAALYRATAQRLASELEIIVNARLEAALARAGEEIRREVRNHIEIVLPEIVSALAAAETPPRRD